MKPRLDSGSHDPGAPAVQAPAGIRRRQVSLSADKTGDRAVGRPARAAGKGSETARIKVPRVCLPVRQGTSRQPALHGHRKGGLENQSYSPKMSAAAAVILFLAWRKTQKESPADREENPSPTRIDNWQTLTWLPDSKSPSKSASQQSTTRSSAATPGEDGCSPARQHSALITNNTARAVSAACLLQTVQPHLPDRSRLRESGQRAPAPDYPPGY